ncbi:MAG: hypothetical protein J3K34DRAFT_229499 [Monoraphidium minutum]|nr:MAG: hypothetical protein J3K34DRAFT_229499 [Monoraphidium minutum]
MMMPCMRGAGRGCDGAGRAGCGGAGGAARAASARPRLRPPARRPTAPPIGSLAPHTCSTAGGLNVPSTSRSGSSGGDGTAATGSSASSGPSWQAACCAALASALLVLGPAAAPPPPAAAAAAGGDETETLSNVPGQLGASGADAERREPLSRVMGGANKKAIEACTRKCVPTCVRGGEGAPGLGPISMRREPGGAVFKEAYRSRGYCLSECANVCALTTNAAAAAKGGGCGRGAP